MELKDVCQKALLRLKKEKKYYEKEIEKLNAKIEAEKAKKTEMDEKTFQYLENSLDETKRALSDVKRNIDGCLEKLKRQEDD